ncbi:MAG TPA: hypothetical protein PKN33_07880 [Phycisphaerae bacterium]|nr:hypothetical protein [Phycisphaerae bacterium]
MIEHISTREQLIELIGMGAGFLYNDFGGSNPKHCPVHEFPCAGIKRMLYVNPGPLAVPKVWSDNRTELVRWLEERKKAHRTCSLCGDQEGHVHTSSKPLIQTSQTSKMRAPEVQFRVTGPADERPFVEVWSNQRLQYEGGGRMAAIRTSIQHAVKSMSPVSCRACHAVFLSPDSSMCDAENVLFYNVGTSSFSHLAKGGVGFERGFGSIPRMMDGGDFDPMYYHRYALVPADADWQLWAPSNPIASFKTDLMANRQSLLRPERVWTAVQSGKITVHTPAPHTDCFGLRAHLRGPRSMTRRSADLIKPVFDGIVAAFHSHNGVDVGPCSERVAGLLACDASFVATRLMATERAALGVRRLLWMWGESVQWNPADDLCVAGTLRIIEDDSLDGIRLEGDLSAVTALPYSEC